MPKVKAFLVITAATTTMAAAIPGRVALGFNLGGGVSANDHERWGASTAGYAYYVEVTYLPVTVFAFPLIQYGYGYGREPMPGWEAGGYAGEGDTLRTESASFFLGSKARASLWRMKLRPYAGLGLLRTDYHRKAAQGDYILQDYASGGWGYAAVTGLEFFPDPARRFSMGAEYRYGVTAQRWLAPPSLYKYSFVRSFTLQEQALALGVKLYIL